MDNLIKYVGTKEVSAIPCTLGEFKKESGRNPYQNHDSEHSDEEEGYKVVYKDGYVSWSPKAVFDEAYKPCETYLDRMRIEYDELNSKLEKLQKFITTSVTFANFPTVKKAMLQAQEGSMYEYMTNLGLRMADKLVEDVQTNLSGLTFGSAIHLLRNGFAVRRAGWNGKGMFIVKQVPAHINHEIIPNMQSLPEYAKDILMNSKNRCIDYRNQMLIVNAEGVADSWVPSSSDVFAEDWELVTE